MTGGGTMLAETVQELHAAMKHDFQLLTVLIGICAIVIVLCVMGRR